MFKKITTCLALTTMLHTTAFASREMHTAEMRESVSAGLADLVQDIESQGVNGIGEQSKVGETALAGLALMANGYLPGRGEYGPHVEACLEYVINCVGSDGFIADNSSGSGAMYSHGFALLFLAEIYGQSHDPRLRDAIMRGIAFSVRTQSNLGGWRYTPFPSDQDISVTICHVKALRAARNAGFSVPNETINKAISYVSSCQDQKTGTFGYTNSSGATTMGRMGAGLSSLNYAGIYESSELTLGLDHLYGMLSEEQSDGWDSGYGHYYAAQALYVGGKHYWQEGYPLLVERVMSNQKGNNGWGAVHDTALNILSLSVSVELLPIFQR